MNTHWNPRFVAYAKAHGRTPEAMLKHDEAAWPGGQMCGFILWIQERMIEFLRSDHPDACCRGHAGLSRSFTDFLFVCAKSRK